MTVFSYSLNYPSQCLKSISWQRNQNRKCRNQDFAIPPPSIIPQSEESGNLFSKKSSLSNSASITNNSSGSLLTQSNAVGIIGGASVETTLHFMKRLIKWSSKNEENGIPFLLSSDPALSKVLLSYERSSFPFFRGRVQSSQQDPAPIIEYIRRKRMFLEDSGAQCIVMPCNLSHSWYEEITKGCSVPFLHMGECVAKELKDQKLKPLEAGSNLKIGVVGTNAVLSSAFYQRKLCDEGFEVEIPDKALTEHTLVPAVEALSRRDIKGAQTLFRILLENVKVKAVNVVILASDDLREILPPNDPVLKKCIDPIDVLAKATVKYVQSAENGF